MVEGKKFVDTKLVPRGREIFAQECASCHSSKVAPENVRNDKNALAKFYDGHVFGKEDYWETEFTESKRTNPEFIAKYLAKDEAGKLRPKQFVENGVFGQDWLETTKELFIQLSEPTCVALSMITTTKVIYGKSLHPKHIEKSSPAA